MHTFSMHIWEKLRNQTSPMTTCHFRAFLAQSFDALVTLFHLVTITATLFQARIATFQRTAEVWGAASAENFQTMVACRGERNAPRSIGQIDSQ